MAETVREKGKRVGWGIFPLFALTIFGFYWPNFVSAQEGAFSLEPLYTEVDIMEGDAEKRIVMTLFNRTGADATFRLSAVDFGSLDESGGVAFLGSGSDGGSRYGLASWIALENEQVTVPAGETQEIPVTIRNRESLSPGGHYGAIVFHLDEAYSSEDESSVVAVNSSFASLIFAKKRGGETYDLAYRGIVGSQEDFRGIPDRISLRFQNAGNMHVVPRGRVIVTDPFGRIVRKGILNEESARILPESFRVYGLPLRPVASAFVPGWYTVSVEYRYDGKDETTTVPEEKVLPFGINLLWVFGVVSFTVFFWKYLKRNRRKNRRNILLSGGKEAESSDDV